MTDHDPRLVELYDQDNPDGPDHDFYRALADEIDATSVLDLGCGTGILTVTFARTGRTVVGVDPSAAMLAYAERRPGAGAVSWVLGDSRAIPDARFDYAVMTGNVAQHIPDPAWETTLRGIRGRMAPRGVLAFESRNPAARAWETWDSGDRTARMTPHGELIEWTEAVEVGPGVVECAFHSLFADRGEQVIERQLLAFRGRATITGQLEDAGFVVDAVYGDWRRTPFREDGPLMVFVAHAS